MLRQPFSGVCRGGICPFSGHGLDVPSVLCSSVFAGFINLRTQRLYYFGTSQGTHSAISCFKQSPLSRSQSSLLKLELFCKEACVPFFNSYGNYRTYFSLEVCRGDTKSLFLLCPFESLMSFSIPLKVYFF